MFLLLLLLIPLIGIFIISNRNYYIASNSNTREIKFIGLTTSIINLNLSLIIWIIFDFSQNQFQFVQEYHKVSFCDFYLGVDGLSIYFVVRPLTKKNINSQLSKSLLLLFALAGCRPRSTSNIFCLFSRASGPRFSHAVAVETYFACKMVIYLAYFLFRLKGRFARWSLLLSSYLYSAIAQIIGWIAARFHRAIFLVLLLSVIVFIFARLAQQGRSFSTISSARGGLARPSPPASSLMSLNPWFITGFTDAEGCFYINIREYPGYTTGWRVEVAFQISLHKKDRALLEMIRAYFGGVGGIFKHGKDSILYYVSSFKDLPVVIDHLDKSPLITQKRADFELFKKAVDLMNRKEHLTHDGLTKVVSLKASINNGLSPKLKEVFPEIVPVQRPIVADQEIKDPQWLAGFTSGEGCFLINIKKSSSHKAGSQILLSFDIAQHSRDEQLMNYLVSYFDCGKVRKRPNQLAVDYIVTKIEDLTEKVIPFFEKYPIIGVKALDFQDFCKAAELMKTKAHLRASGLEQIRKLKAGMNRGRQMSTLARPQLNHFINCFGFAGKIEEINLVLSTLVPVRVYKNAEGDKEEVLKENRNKCGVYQWTNGISGKTYVGSSIDLGNRLKNYYSYKYITDPRQNMSIHKALLKYGYSNFKLGILEYCDPDKAIVREQYYIDLLEPAYNILKFAGSRLGLNHSSETKEKFRIHGSSLKNLEHLNTLNSRLREDPEWKANHLEALKKLHADPEWRIKTSERLKIFNESFKGRARPEGAGKPAIQLLVCDLEAKTETLYPSVSEAAKALGISPKSISRYYSENSKPYKGRYMLNKFNPGTPGTRAYSVSCASRQAYGGDIYIGSSVDLGNRLGQYYSKKYLEITLKKGNSIICASLLKNGFSNFSLQILEYCTADKVIEREQYYIDLLHPNYNIFPVAGSSYGFKHSSGTKEKFRILGSSLKNLEHLKNLNSRLRDDPLWKANHLEALKKLHADPVVKTKRSEALKKLNADPEWKIKTLQRLKILHASLKGRARPEGAGKPAIQIEVCDLETQTKTLYPSKSETAKALGVSPRSLTRYFSDNTPKPYKGRYLMKKISP
jgi:group I intron endonuclease